MVHLMTRSNGKMKYLTLFILSTMFALVACSNDGSATSSAEEKKTVFDSQINALEKTRNIENILQKSADERQGELDNQ